MGTSRPFSPSRRISVTPPTSVASTGVPTARASTTMCGKFSQLEERSAAAAELLALGELGRRHGVRDHDHLLRRQAPAERELPQRLARDDHAGPTGEREVARPPEDADPKAPRVLERAQVGAEEAPAERALEDRVGGQLEDDRPPRERGAEARAADHPGRVDDVRLPREPRDEPSCDNVPPDERRPPHRSRRRASRGRGATGSAPRSPSPALRAGAPAGRSRRGTTSPSPRSPGSPPRAG